MSKIKITFVEPVEPVEANVAQICAVFEPQNAYIDTEAYEGTVYDTNVEGFGTWEGIAAYVASLTAAPNILIMLKAAARDGEVEFEEEDPKMVEYIKELGAALEEHGFTIEVVEANDGE